MLGRYIGYHIQLTQKPAKWGWYYQKLLKGVQVGTLVRLPSMPILFSKYPILSEPRVSVDHESPEMPLEKEVP